MLNLSALVGDTVTQVFAKLWNVKRNLQKSQRRLRELTSETEFIASAISHELKNPLSAAANAADLLIAEAGTATPDDVREFAGIVHHNVTKAYDMLTELRQVVVAANRDERPEEIALDRLVHNVVNEALRRSDRLAPQIRIAGELPLIEGQPQKVSQVFRNLLENALEHARTSTHPIVRVDGLGPDTQSGFLRFAVSDNGPGVPEEHRERIFEPFVTLGEGLREGRGLGLALVRRIIREGGGNIWVERSDLGGARFVFTLPRSAEANPSDVEDEPEGPES
jgi:signal transduction histidine kinase